MARSSWGADPYARGSFSYLAVGSRPAQRDLLAAPVANRLFFAGEATSRSMPGTVAGARETGLRAASEVNLFGTPGERIAVIGAGIAGATAASKLANDGFEVTVLEARERVGGRIDTRTLDDWGIPIELGAGLVDSSSTPALLSALQSLDIITLTLGESTTIRTPEGDEIEPSMIGKDAIAAAVDAARDLPSDVPLASVIEQAHLDDAAQPAETAPVAEVAVTPEEWVQSYLRNDIGLDFGAGADELSAQQALSDGERDADRIVLGEYQSLVAGTLDGVSVWTTNAVSTLSYGDEGVGIRFATGESLQVDRAIVTVPLGVLKSGDIRFEPRLPLAHTVAIHGLGMGTVDKIWLRFDEAFWATEAVHWTIVGGDLDITEWLNLEPLTGSPILVGIVGGDRATALAELGDDELIERARLSLEPFVG